MKNFLILPLITLLVSSCATQQLYLNITRPAPVTIAPDIKTVGIIDRSTPTDQTKSIDMLEKVLSLEGADLDSVGSLEAMKGVTEELMNNDRFDQVKLLSDIKFKTTGLGSMPSPLTWEQVDVLCSESGTQALFALEMYDTDTRVSYSAAPVKIKTPLGEIPGLEHTASMETLVRTGWRIYSPSDRAIPDEYIVTESVIFAGRGINPVAAVGAILKRRDAVKEVSRKTGNIYAMRLLPYQIRVMRDYYVKGTNNFKIAKRRAQVGNWNEAAELWQQETFSPKRKIAGRASYNMAIISEINGDIDGAIDWARKSYTDYRIRPGLDYVHILENRRYNNELLQYQEER